MSNIGQELALVYHLFLNHICQIRVVSFTGAPVQPNGHILHLQKYMLRLARVKLRIQKLPINTSSDYHDPSYQ